MNPNETPKARFPRTLARTGALLAASLLFASTSSLSAGPRNYPRGPEPAFSAIYVFGDSLSDTGRAASVLNPPPPPGSDWLNGRESDGPLWIEQISPILGVDYVAANNFAWGGATSGTGNIYGPGVLPGMLDELAEYLAGLPLTGADPDALYVVFGGSNDFLEVLSGSAGADALAETVANLVTIVHTLRAYGARHIVLVDVPDIGVAPRVLAF